MIDYREMTTADISVGIDLCRMAEWNQLERDWEQFLRLSPNSCHVATKENRIVGTVTTISYPDRFGWIGMMLVDPKHRRQGIGTQLMKDALRLLSDHRTVRLDATPVGREVYLKLDFVDDYELSRMVTVVPETISKDNYNPARPMTMDDLPAVFEMDLNVFGADRLVLLKWLFEGAPEYAWIIGNNGRIDGYCFGRTGFYFEYLGPLVAEDSRIASELISACLCRQAGRAVALDAPHHSTDWLRWLGSIGFTEQRLLIRMYRGENCYPGLPKNVFAILGPEFG